MTPDLEAKLAGRRVVASVSGGKDSAALSLHLRELGIEHDRVFMDTGWEKASTYDYLRGELTKALGPIKEIRGTRSMVELIRSKQTFPSRVRRFCTEELKVFPFIAYVNERRERDGIDLVNAVGIRHEEGTERNGRASALEWEWQDEYDCEVWRPLVAWTLDDVVAIHRRHGLPPNPLYLEGATRVGCWPCIFARKREIKLVAETDPARIAIIEQLEEELTAKSGSQRAFFNGKTGRGAVAPVADVVRWSKTDDGGRQFPLIVLEDEEPGCMRWGLCEAAK